MIAKRKKRQWPPWWEWQLDLTDYTYKRVIETRFRRNHWKVVVEPKPEKQRLVIVTVYQVEKLI